MSWDCPYWNNEICQLNGIKCVPGKGQCVLKSRFVIKQGDVKKQTEEERIEKTKRKAKSE
jgi:hypothetical protein